VIVHHCCCDKRSHGWRSARIEAGCLSEGKAATVKHTIHRSRSAHFYSNWLCRGARALRQWWHSSM